jgi:Fur family ferric uptake transcriptional regulator
METEANMNRAKGRRNAGCAESEDEREEVRVFHEHIRRSGLKRTAQRDLILDVFLRTEGHVSSEDLYELVKAEDPSVGFTTVYRTLKLLQECGLARDVQYYDGRMLYEHDIKQTHHDHLICTSCGKLIEFFSEVIENMQDEIAARHQFRPESHSLRIFGKCHDCQVRAKAKAK